MWTPNQTSTPYHRNFFAQRVYDARKSKNTIKSSNSLVVTLIVALFLLVELAFFFGGRVLVLLVF